MGAFLAILVLAPLAAASLASAARTQRQIEQIQFSQVFILWTTAAGVVSRVVIGEEGTVGSFLRADELSAFMDLMLAFVGGTALIYAAGYMGEELSRGQVAFRRFRRFFVYLNLNLFTMLLAVNTDNIAVMWIAIEGSTLSIALLVGFDRTKSALEAGWKFIILSFVGIALALFGTVLIYYTSEHVLGVGMEALRWSALARTAGSLNPAVLKIAFIFVLIGYGTKAGVAPMHTWLPDAHAEAPTPISAVLSGLMLNLAIYAVLRLKAIVDPAVGGTFTGSVMLGLGLLSMGIAATFMLIQRDYKRLLAYSSIEHVGITLVGFGVGGPIGMFAGFFHMLNHALAKSAAFYAAGMILLKHGHKIIDRITGLLRQSPALGTGLLLALVALSGLPPFGLFFSEVLIVTASYAFHPWIACVFLLFLVLAFATLVAHGSRMVLGVPSYAGRETGDGARRLMIGAMVLNVAAMGILGIIMPDFFRTLFLHMGALFQGP